MRISQLIEDLCILNIKLFEICNVKAKIAANPENFSKDECVANAAADIELCKQRAALKKAIDKAIRDAIIKGDTTVIDEVKSYG